MPRELPALLVCLMVVSPATLLAGGTLQPAGSMPALGAVVDAPALAVRLSAPCDTDPSSLTVTLDGAAVPTAALLPFSSCSEGTMTTRTALVPLDHPDTTITAAPDRVAAGTPIVLAGSGTGDTLHWTFDGGAPPAVGETVDATVAAAGTYTLELQATRTLLLDATARAGRTRLRLHRPVVVGDPTPARHTLVVTVDPDADHVNLESSHVHPLALTADRRRLYAVDTPGARVTVFALADDGTPAHADSIPVGLEPVSLALHPDGDALWVVNQLSDTVSVVDLDAGVVVETLTVGDEPTDVAFAGGRAFVSVQGEDRIAVFDATDRSHVASVDVFGDGPRALAVNADGDAVHAVVLRSGNRTTIMSPSGFGAPNPPPADPPRGPHLPPHAPFGGVIVRFNSATSDWEDEHGIDRGHPCCGLPISLPDLDLFTIDATAATPAVTGAVAGIGTTLTDVVVRPGTGEVWVPNTDARNVVRFAPVLDGHLVDTRVSIVEPATGGVVAIDLNPHVDRAVTPGPAAEIAQSLSQPGASVFTPDGTRLYLAAFGSASVGVLDGYGTVVDRIAVGNGPSGVALDTERGRLWVLNQLDHTLSVVDTATRTQVAVTGLAGPSGFDPTPDVVRDGRRFLYDARTTSGHGDVACATCHFAGHVDGLAWDLGDPNGRFLAYADAPWLQFFIPSPRTGFDPMKGPLVTQTLRGLRDAAPFHWRGDRPDLLSFSVNFPELQGTAGPLPDDDMARFAAFLETIRVPPNPYRALDDTLPPSLAVPGPGGTPVAADPNRGAVVFDSVGAIGNLFPCTGCHTLPTGSDHRINNELGTQDFETPDLRHLREKLDFGPFGPQKRGFGVEHDGGRPLADFLASSRFTLSAQDERDVLAFTLSLPGGLAPAVGHQTTVRAEDRTAAAVRAELDVLRAEAAAGACDLVAHGRIDGTRRGFAYDVAAGRWLPSDGGAGIDTDALLASLGYGDVVTVTGVPPGTGRRLGVDRDRDGWLDDVEVARGLDPADPRDTPWTRPLACDAAMAAGARLVLRDLTRDHGRQGFMLRGTLAWPMGVPFAPANDGVRVIVDDLGAGGALLDCTVPRHDGWRTAGAGRVAVHRRRAGTASPCAHLRFTDRRNEGGGIEVTASARRAGIPTPTGPLRVTVLIGDAARAVTSGRCGAHAFGPSACRLGHAGQRLRCR